ncbi:MAG TPA: ABC transporter substrate-binding protein [Roseomonas sp.]|jgi:peptide/nickel transport system substrate-binding protein
MIRNAKPLAALATIALALSAGPVAAQTLTLATKLQLTTLDPHFFNGFPTASAHAHIWESLARINERLELEPELAESWQLIDNNTWEFKLRRDVRFHDGSPFTADDVIATIARVPNIPNSPALFTSFIRSVKEVLKVDDHTIRVVTSGPAPTQPFDLARIFILSAGDTKATTSDFNAGRVNGTGPYRFARWENGVSMTLSRNDAWWRGREPWEQVELRTIASDASRVAALLSGEVDGIDVVPTADKPRIAADSRFRIVSGVAGVVQYIALDAVREQSPFVGAAPGQPALTRNPLMDRRVRRALSLSINREALADRLMEGSATPASQFLPNEFDGTSPNLRPDPYDLNRARALLREAGYPNGFRLTLHATNDRYPKDGQLAQAIGQMWTRAGLQITVEGVPGQVFFGAATRQEYSAFSAQYGVNQASDGLRAVIHTNDAKAGLGAANRTRFSNPRIDALVLAALTEMDAEKRRQAEYRAIEAAMEEQAIIPIFHPTWDFAVRRGLNVVSRPERRFNALMVRPAG